MKGTKVFLTIMAALFALLLCVQISIPADFVWNPTFHHDDPQPYGSMVFDSVMSRSLPRGYTVGNSSLDMIARKDGYGKCNILITADESNIDTDGPELKKFIKAGANVLVSYNDQYTYDYDELLDAFGISLKTTGYYNIDSYINDIRHNNDVQTMRIRWTHGLPRKEFSCYPFIVSGVIGECPGLKGMPCDTLATTEVYYYKNGDYENYACYDHDDDDYERITVPVAVRLRMGKGSLIVVSTPLVFSNYGVMNRELSEFSLRLMAMIADKPVVRTTAYNANTTISYNDYQSPTGFLLDHKPLRVAFQLTGAAVLLFMAFNARRRQRAIPVMRQMKSNSLEFTQLIGSLYFQRHDNNDLVRKKFLFFADTVRKRLQVDITKMSDDRDSTILLAQCCGIEEAEAKSTILYLRTLYHSTEPITDLEMKNAVKTMNRMTRCVLE